MIKSKSGQKMPDIAEKKTSGIEEKRKNGGPIRSEEFGHVIDHNNNKKQNSPENDRNNVAFYKKEEREKKEKKEKKEELPVAMSSKAVSPNLFTPSRSSSSSTSETSLVGERFNELKTWASVASTPLKQEKKTVDPKFLAEEAGFDRIVVTPTKFNKKVFDGFITSTEANLIRKEIKLDYNVHGTTFNRNSDGKLFITFKLVSNLTLDEIQQSVKKYFSINKTSNAGHQDKISGEVIHPNLEGPKSDQENFNRREQVPEKETTEIKIEGSNYQLTEEEILTVLDSYGAIEGEMEEVAMVTPDGEFGTGTYLVKIKLDRTVPNIVPMYGLLIKVSHKKTKKQCSKCFGYHKSSIKCERKQFTQYIDKFVKKYAPSFPVERKAKNDHDFSY